MPPGMEAPLQPRQTCHYQAQHHISQREFFAYRLFQHMGETDHIFRAGRLFQQFMCDAWAAAEQSNLRWIENNQRKIRSDLYQGLVDAVHANPDAHSSDQGQRVILPSSFTGSKCDMIECCQDALAINRFHGGADLFITATANPNWPEIQRELFPGQNAADQRDLVTRVF